jgi:transposase
MTKRACKTYDAKFKAKVAIEAISSSKDLIEISAAHNVPKTTIIEWKERLLNEASELFISAHEKDKKVKQLTEKIKELHNLIGEITIENNFFKKKLQK